MIKFYKCRHCGQVVAKIVETPVKVICCGEPMEELVANTVDASKEKHLPVYEIKGDKVYVTVGSILHPMEEAHYIKLIGLETSKGVMMTELIPGVPPKAEFVLPEGAKVLTAFCYCNLHGLWQK